MINDLVQQKKWFLLAAVLDPRFKNIHFSDPIALSNIIRHLKHEMSISVQADGSSSDISKHSEGSDKHIFDLWAPHKNIAH